MGHNENCCKQGHCKPRHWCDSGDHMTDQLVKMADTAWEHLMLDKMKKALEAKRGPHMNKMAEAAVNASLTYWMGKMKSHEDLHHSLDNVKKAFS